MPLDTSIFDDDLAEAISDLPSSFTWQSVAYSCSASRSSLADMLTMAGVEETIDATLVCRLSILPSQTAPQRGAKVTWSGNLHRVVKTDYDEVSATIYLAQENA